MITKSFQDLRLSALGMGCMRLPTVEGDDTRIDEEATAKMVAYAIEHGINYFDTAWVYHGGQSEIVMGKVLGAYPRESFYLATKFPGFSLDNMEKVEEIFEKQLEKCGVEYFDFYLFHNVSEGNIDGYLDPKYGIFEYLMKQKKAGRIRHLGFSAHGEMPVLKRFLDAYGKEMEFCQLQINYMDWTFQKAKEKVDLLREYGIPVWVMEPVRGGRLAKLSPENEATLKALRPDESAPAWAFRFIQSIPEVCVTLSGMSNFEQLKENIRTFEESKPLNEAETEAISTVADRLIHARILPCTACRYCVEHCPQGLDIPSLLAVYNEHCLVDGAFTAPEAIKALPQEKWPSACLACHSCEAVCPQKIEIAKAMASFKRRMK